MISLSDKMAAANNRPTGFDYMRLILATAVISQHTVSVCYGYAAGDTMFMVPFRGLYGLVLPMFFALSGFLVAGSLERNKSPVSFLGLRAIRLLPALSVEIVLSALILGPLLTNLPLRQYFSDHEFRSYFLNILGDIHYNLPGIYPHNPIPFVVNAQLWTIPWELKCYLALAAIAVVGIVARPRYLLAFIVGLQVVAVYHVVHDHPTMHARVVGWVMLFSFLAGLFLFRMRRRVPFSFGLFLWSAALTELLLNVRGGDYLAALPVAYCTAYLGLLNPPKNRYLLSGDYSYGIYLYGFPIQQAVVASGLVPLTPVWNFVVAYPLAFALAIFSWHCIEKPASKLKRYVMTCEGWLLRVPPIEWHARQVFAVRRTGAQG